MSSKRRPRSVLVALRSRFGAAGARILFGAGLLAVATFTYLMSSARPSEVDRVQQPAQESVQPTVQEEAAALRLLLASHGRLMWYTPATDAVHVLHEGGGVHYGVFPGDQHSVWMVLRPHNWHPKDTKEVLLELDMDTGQQLSQHVLESRFTHDAVRRGNTVYMCSTGDGNVLQLELPSMTLVKRHPLFTVREHVNTLAPLRDDVLWAVLHNLGTSELVQLQPSGGSLTEVRRIPGIGTKAHGLVELPSGALLMLDSDNGRLVSVDPEAGVVTPVYQVPDAGIFLKGLAVVDGVAYFGISKALERRDRADADRDSELAAVQVDTGALLWRRQVPTHGLLNVVAAPQFGETSTYQAVVTGSGSSSSSSSSNSISSSSSTTSGSSSDSGSSNAVTEGGTEAGSGASDDGMAPASGRRSLVDRRRRRASGRQLSITHMAQQAAAQAITAQANLEAGTPLDAAPDTAQPANSGSSQQAAVGTAENGAPQAAGNATALLWGETGPENPDAAINKTSRHWQDMGFPPVIGGHWSTQHPYFDLSTKDSMSSWAAGVQLPLAAMNISALKAKMVAWPRERWSSEYQTLHNAVVTGRDDNMNKFKPGVLAMYLVFSDRGSANAYQYPYYDHFKEELEPLIQQIIGVDGMRNIIRLQFAMMPPGSVIHMHRDTGGYATKGHRIHIPVVYDENIRFEVCPGLDQRVSRTLGEVSDRNVEPGDCVPLPMFEGMVFEINNRILHRVRNYGNISRVQLVVDVAEHPIPRHALSEGAVCAYIRGIITCPEGVVRPVSS